MVWPVTIRTLLDAILRALFDPFSATWAKAGSDVMEGGFGETSSRFKGASAEELRP